MNDWQVGDLAVWAGPIDEPDVPKTICPELKKGAHRVDGVIQGPWRCRTGLVFGAFPSSHSTGCWDHRGFRKILPDKHEECEPEFVTLLKRIKIGVSA